MRDEFELIAIAAESISGTNAFEAVDEGFGGYFELEGVHWGVSFVILHLIDTYCKFCLISIK